MRCTMYKEELWLSLEYLLGGTLEEMLEQHALKEKHIKYITRYCFVYCFFLFDNCGNACLGMSQVLWPSFTRVESPSEI